MARVSIDDTGSASSAKVDIGRSSGSAKSSKSGGGLDHKQKVKAGVAVAVIVLAGAFILWNTGLLGSPGANPAAPEDNTAADLAAFNESQEAAAKVQQQRTPGNTRTAPPPMPLGAN